MLSNTLVFAASGFLSKLITALLLPLYTRTLTREEYGMIELIIMLAALFYPAVSLSIQDAAYRFAFDEKQKQSAVLKNSLIIASLGALLLIAIAAVLNAGSPIKGYGYYFYIYAMLSLLRGILSSYIKACGRMKAFAADSAIYNCTLLAGGIFFLVFLKQGMNGYFLAMILASLISLVFLYRPSGIRKAVEARYDSSLMKQMISYSLPLVINCLAWGFSHVVDRLALTEYLSAQASGIFGVAARIPSLLTALTGIFTEAWSITLIRDYQSERDSAFYSSTFKSTCMVCLLLAGAIVFFNNSIILFLLGEDFKQATVYVPTLLAGAVFLTVANFFSPFFAAAKTSHINSWTAVPGCLVQFILCKILIPPMGIMGACLAVTSCYLVIGTLRMVCSRKVIAMDLDARRFVFGAGLLLGLSTAVYLGCSSELSASVYLLSIALLYRKELSGLFRMIGRSFRHG